jgi:hypothetical protein
MNRRTIHLLIRPVIGLITILIVGPAAAQQDLVIDGESGTTHDGGTYRRLIISNTTNVTVRNATFTYSGYGDIVNIRSSTGLVVENNDIDGQGKACTGIDVRGGSSDVWIRNNIIHGIGDDGMEVKDIHDVHVIGNIIYGLISDPVNCNNGHSDGIEIFNLDDSEFIGNLIYDVRGTSAFFFGNYSSSTSTYCNNIVLENNVFFTPESGFVIYIYETNGVRLINNTFWNGRYGGLSIGNDVKDLEAVNNVMSSLNYAHNREPYDAVEHTYRDSLLGVTVGQWTPEEIIGVDGNFVLPDPLFETIPKADNNNTVETDWRQVEGQPLILDFSDFALKDGSAARDIGDIAYSPDFDALGVAIPQGTGPDLGALETPVPVPEPSVALLQIAGIATLVWIRKRRFSLPEKQATSTLAGTR